MTIDAAASGALMNKPYPEACALIEDMAQNHYQWGTEQASVNYAQGDPYSNTYNPRWRNHPNVSYKNNNPTPNSTSQRPSDFQTQRPNQPMQVTSQKTPKKNVVITPEKQVEEPVEPEKQKYEEVKDKEGEKDTKVYVPPLPYKPLILFPQRLKQTKLYNQYKKFVKVIEKLHVWIPFTEEITQIPSYAKFLKDILTNKRRLDDPKPLECNSIAENKLAKREKDPGSFSIPYVLGNYVIDKALMDLGASVSLMPLAVYNRLNLGEMQPTRMSLELANRSVKYPI
ncbi:uncharacterized protein LOC127087542 [Lathyrus oleraceus]|uniref:uncharacterized protein LOC127087542 n=1 Tax=Pisum sativum TaxID=3888 RepID=UPI0021D1892F|nr:uncharacterized protein LOC127087542 [Pisum sativum]